MANIISDPIWSTIKEKVKEGNLTELLDIYNNNNLDYNAKGGKYNRTVLHEAAEQDKQKIAGYLIQLGAEVDNKDKYGYTPLKVAAYNINNSVELAKLLLEQGADVNTKDNDGDTDNENGDTPLHVAAHHNSIELAELLLEHGAEVNTKDINKVTPLHVAARHKNVELAKLLLEHSAEVNTKNKNGVTPLHVAARHNNVELAKLLIEQAAEVNTKNNDGDTSLQEAARHNNVGVAKLLLEQAAEVNTKNNDGDTPLKEAARHNNVGVAKLLLAHGAEVNTKDNKRVTPLQEAARHNRVELAKLMLEQGAGVNTKNNDGDTPLHVATRLNSIELAKLLIEHGADISTTDKNSESGLQYMQKTWSNSDLQDTFRALPKGVEYSNPDVIIHELEIKDDFDDDVKSTLSSILIKAIENLLDFENDPKKQFMLYKRDLRVPLVKELLKRSEEKTLLEGLYIALQVKALCNQTKKEIGLGYNMQFQRKIKELANDVVVRKEVKVIAEQIYSEYMKDKTGYCSEAWKSMQDFLKSSFQQLKKCCGLTSCCQNEERFYLPIPSWVYHGCYALGMMGKVLCSLGIFFYISDVYSDFVVGISDMKGVSRKLGIFEIALVSITLCHENFISANSLYTMEEEFLRIKCFTDTVSAEQWSDSKLNWSEDRFKMFFYKLSWPFKLQGNFLSKATLYNLLTCVQLRPVVDRLVILLHEPISLRQYYKRQAEQNSLKQFYPILEQLPQLLVQFYTFQIVINNLSSRDIEQVAGDCYHYFDYERMNTNSTNDTNLFCESLPLSDAGSGTCGTVFRIYSMAIPFYNIPKGIASLEESFRKLDPLTPKMSTISKIIFQASYTLMIPARLFMFAALMHAVSMKEYVFGFIIFRVIMELLVNLHDLISNRNSNLISNFKSHIKPKFAKLSLQNHSIPMILFSIRDVFLISIRSPDAYLARPSDVSHKSLRGMKNLAVRAVPFICEGLAAALIIEQRYPCGKQFNYFKYLGWVFIVPLLFSVSAMIMVSDRFHPFKGRSSSLVKETKKLLLAGFISIVFMGVVAWTFIVSQKRGSVELLVMGLAVSLHIVLVAGLSLYLKMSNKSKETPYHKMSNKSKETLYTRVVEYSSTL